MTVVRLTEQEVLDGYDAVVALYPYVPPLSHWRAWEYAAYQKLDIKGRVLDLGCGDGRYFQLIWPQLTDAVGVDMDQEVAELGRQSGVYREVYTSPAHTVPENDASFDHIFANCSLEHMDDLGAVLSEVNRCLKLGGSLLCSVVTNRFLEWSLLPNLVSLAGFDGSANSLRKEFLDYHHLVNPLSVDKWLERFEQAGFAAEVHIPIIPKYNSGMFLLMDNLWHIGRREGGELGDVIFPFLSSQRAFPGAFRKIFEGLLEMETEWSDCSGAVFSLCKVR